MRRYVGSAFVWASGVDGDPSLFTVRMAQFDFACATAAGHRVPVVGLFREGWPRLCGLRFCVSTLGRMDSQPEFAPQTVARIPRPSGLFRIHRRIAWPVGSFCFWTSSQPRTDIAVQTLTACRELAISSVCRRAAKRALAACWAARRTGRHEVPGHRRKGLQGPTLMSLRCVCTYENEISGTHGGGAM